MLAIALVLDGCSREVAAQSCAMDRQTLRDWVHRYNELVWPGCPTIPAAMARVPACRPSSKPWWRRGWSKVRTSSGTASCAGAASICSSGSRESLRSALHERTVGKLLRKLSFRRLSVRPQHPQSKPEAQALFKVGLLIS